MDVATDTQFNFDNSFVRELTGLYEPWQAAAAPAPRLLALDESLAVELGLDPATLRSPSGVELLVGNRLAPGAEPVAQAYAGHQFGGYSPRLGDGRALLLGEVLDVDGRRRDLHLKGSGRTPFSRGGDGKAAVGPMLREFLVAAAMHALDVPTARALSVVATGETVQRDAGLPGAVLLRVASSHIRVGTFQYAAALGDVELVRRLAEHSIDRHHPDARTAANPYLALLDAVTDAQASLVARWMLVGFIHGVMNTDNVTISGETIDYGPCAFMDAFDPATVFSSIDHAGRYAYGNQPQIAQWNLARFAETLLELLGPSTDAAVEAATEVLHAFPARFEQHFNRGMRAKLGLGEAVPDATQLADDLLSLMADGAVDFTNGFRSLSSVLRAPVGTEQRLAEGGPFAGVTGFEPWRERWTAALGDAGGLAQVAAEMDAVNPCYVPRNHLVEAALEAANDGELGPFEELLEVVTDPYVQRDGFERYEAPAPPEFASFQTFCGT